MQKYNENDNYKVIRQRDSKKKYTSNKDDIYIPCKKGVQIYRYNADQLAISFNTKRYASTKLGLLLEEGVSLYLLQNGDKETTFLFSEEQFDIVAKIVEAKHVKKRELTPEQKEAARQRMAYARKNLSNKSNT